jgi:hypothetical protein
MKVVMSILLSVDYPDEFIYVFVKNKIPFQGLRNSLLCESSWEAGV